MFAILLFILKNDKVLYFLPNFEKLKEKLIKTNESTEMLLQEENREITLDWSEYMERTALLKVLLEGGTIIDNGYSTYYKPYGELVEGNGSSIKVTPVSTTTFNANPNQIWDYDVVVFGFGDRNGAAEEQLNDAGVEELRK